MLQAEVSPFLSICCTPCSFQVGCTCTQQSSQGDVLKELFVSTSHWGFFEGNSEKRWLFFVVSEGCGAAFTSKSLLAHHCPIWFHGTDFKELGPVCVASGSLGAVFVNLLYALFRPGWMHLHATVRSRRVMCLTNCLCSIPNGLFEGNNLVVCCIHEIFVGRSCGG